MNRTITINAHAKINLSLDVTGLLDNGYHAVDMILQMIELHDVVEVEWIPEAEIEGKLTESDAEPPSKGIRISLVSGSDELPNDEGNLAYQAVLLMAERYGVTDGMVKITIDKKIPLAAGLAGGSGNGAAVILALAYLWDLNAKPAGSGKEDLTELMKVAARLGSDVPFSLMGIAAMNPKAGYAEDKMAATCARATGTGTDLEPLPSFRTGLVLSKPPEGVSTAKAYQAIDHCVVPAHPDVAGQADGICRQDAAVVIQNMINVLENYTLAAYPRVVQTKERMIQASGDKDTVLMSGSGPTVFALTDSEEKRRHIYEALKSMNRETYITRTV